jgi:hypothetical protein
MGPGWAGLRATPAGRSLSCGYAVGKVRWREPPDLHGHRAGLEAAVLLLHQAPAWSGWHDSNVRPLASDARMLPLHHIPSLSLSNFTDPY